MTQIHYPAPEGTRFSDAAQIVAVGERIRVGGRSIGKVTASEVIEDGAALLLTVELYEAPDDVAARMRFSMDGP